MSSGPFARNDDLRRLWDEGYDVELRDAHLLVKHVPYVNGSREVRFGTLVSPVTFAGDHTAANPDHRCWFSGEQPCDQNGSPLVGVINSAVDTELVPGVAVNYMFSSKPSEGYSDYHAKMVAYVRMLSGHAQALQPDVDPRVFPTTAESDEDSPFVYRDSASSRAGITALAAIFHGQRIAIVGLGGSGSYILDLVSKTPVCEIHLFDGDYLLNHNAFRAPGAAPLATLQARPLKVHYFRDVYSQMHRGILAHPYYLDDSRASELGQMDFVFLAADQGMDKPAIIARLEEFGKPFIDVGMGVENVDGALTGLLRVTTSLPEHRDHVHEKNRIPQPGPAVPDDYTSNIQIADLNCLNAALAVARWKRYVGYYHDLGGEGFSALSISTNNVVNEDAA